MGAIRNLEEFLFVREAITSLQRYDYNIILNVRLKKRFTSPAKGFFEKSINYLLDKRRRFTLYNGRNISRLNKEINHYSPGYQIVKSPFFNIPKTEVEIIYEKNDFKIYKPIVGMC